MQTTIDIGAVRHYRQSMPTHNGLNSFKGGLFEYFQRDIMFPRHPQIAVWFHSGRDVATVQRGLARGGDATWSSRRINKPGLRAFLRSSNDGGVKPRSGQAVLRETTPPCSGRKTLGRRRAGHLGATPGVWCGKARERRSGEIRSILGQGEHRKEAEAQEGMDARWT
jgi:hypothetical protein